MNTKVLSVNEMRTVAGGIKPWINEDILIVPGKGSYKDIKLPDSDWPVDGGPPIDRDFIGECARMIRKLFGKN